jgi:hypothetical protein
VNEGNWDYHLQNQRFPLKASMTKIAPKTTIPLTQASTRIQVAPSPEKSPSTSWLAGATAVRPSTTGFESKPIAALGSSQKSVNGASSYNEVLNVMKRDPYDRAHLPTIPLQMFKWFGKHFSFFVGKRSHDILTDKRDYREVGMEKPIHPMGVGFEAKVKMFPTRWSGAFAGGEFLALGRASLSQGNALKTDENGQQQIRSTAMAIKMFPGLDKNTPMVTANIVTENDLNGTLDSNGKALNYLEAAQSNAPPLDVKKIRHSYELLSLLGVAYGALSSPRDSAGKAGIRPPHAWGEMGMTDPTKVNTPAWVEIRPRINGKPVEQNDFRLEFADTLSRDKKITYDIFAADSVDAAGKPKWERAGEMVIDNAILSKGADENVLFGHSAFNSSMTGKPFLMPQVAK